MTYRDTSNRTAAAVRAEIANSPRSMRATVLGCIPMRSASSACVTPSSSRSARSVALSMTTLLVIPAVAIVGARHQFFVLQSLAHVSPQTVSATLEAVELGNREVVRAIDCKHFPARCDRFNHDVTPLTRKGHGTPHCVGHLLALLLVGHSMPRLGVAVYYYPQGIAPSRGFPDLWEVAA